MKISNFLFMLAFFACPSFASDSPGSELIKAALARTQLKIIYDGSCHPMEYPGGDVPSHIWVCTDLIMRSYRELGIDLQKLVHEDMKSHFSEYPQRACGGWAVLTRILTTDVFPICKRFLHVMDKNCQSQINHKIISRAISSPGSFPGTCPILVL